VGSDEKFGRKALGVLYITAGTGNICDRRIPMDEPVAEGDNSMGIADSGTKIWISVDCEVLLRMLRPGHFPELDK
jgi:hypothetical protein